MVLGTLLGVSFLAGCRQDMHNQPKFIPLRESDFFPDKRSERPLVPGTVPHTTEREDTSYYTGLIGDKLLDTMPVPITRGLLKRGQERFNIYCAPCHSVLGDGKGMVARRGYLNPPSFHDDRLRNAPLGHFYRVMTFGSGAMPDYAQQIAPADRWAIVAYIRALQLSQAAPVSDVPQNDRPLLNQPPKKIETVPGKTGQKGMEPPVPVAPIEGGKK
jgi:Cytochrome C oxidase, cbb3-type, subunit III